jgi:hypothetical protein
LLQSRAAVEVALLVLLLLLLLLNGPMGGQRAGKRADHTPHRTPGRQVQKSLAACLTKHRDFRRLPWQGHLVAQVRQENRDNGNKPRSKSGKTKNLLRARLAEESLRGSSYCRCC